MRCKVYKSRIQQESQVNLILRRHILSKNNSKYFAKSFQTFQRQVIMYVDIFNANLGDLSLLMKTSNQNKTYNKAI